MTYEESYMKCETLEQLQKEIASDITIAVMANVDRLPVIKKAGEKVANIKFKEVE